MPEFKEWEKIIRLSRPVIITEKIDGTNGVVYIPEVESEPVIAGSRNGWIAPGRDNFGFAKWVADHEQELRGLGPGYHYGEWWGSGIQRGYGLEKGEKRWSLFNTVRWGESRPACCSVVPVVSEGIFTTQLVEDAIWKLRTGGSLASPGFKQPEGVVVFHVPSRILFKKTLEKDESPKGAL